MKQLWTTLGIICFGVAVILTFIADFKVSALVKAQEAQILEQSQTIKDLQKERDDLLVRVKTPEVLKALAVTEHFYLDKRLESSELINYCVNRPPKWYTSNFKEAFRSSRMGQREDLMVSCEWVFDRWNWKTCDWDACQLSPLSPGN